MSDSVPNAADPARRHVAIYRRLLSLFPSEFRGTYGGLMTQLFRDQCREARQRAKPWAMGLLWAQTVLDTGKAAGREHLSNLRKWFRFRPFKSPLRNTLMNAPIPSRYRAAKWLIPAGMLVGVAVSAIVALTTPDEYRSNSVLMQAPKLMVGGAGTAQTSRGEDTVSATLLLMQNDAVVHRVLNKLKEGQVGTNPPARPTLGAQPGAGGTFILSVMSTNFEYSRQFATAWAQEFVDFKKQQQRSLLADAEARFTQDIFIFQQKLERVTKMRDDLSQKYHITTADDSDSQAQRRLDDAKAEYATLQMELHETEQASAEELALNAPGNRWFEFRLELRRAEHRLEASPNDPALKAEVALRENDLKALLGVTEEMRRTKIDLLSRRVRDRAKHFDELNSAFFDTTTQRGELKRLEEERQRIRAQLDELNRSQLSFSRTNSDSDQFTILSAGGGVPRPVEPNRPYIMLEGFTLGALVGLVLALIRARTSGPKDPGTPSSTASLIPAPIGA